MRYDFFFKSLRFKGLRTTQGCTAAAADDDDDDDWPDNYRIY